MIRIVIVAIWLGFALSSVGQNQPNPFDLKYRPQKAKPSSPPVESKVVVDSLALKEPLLQQEQKQLQDEHQANLKDTLSINVSDNPMPVKEGNNPFELGKGVTMPDSTHSALNKPEKQLKQDILPPSFVVPGKKTEKGIQVFFILLSLLFLIFIVNVERNFVKDLWRVIANENYSSLHLRNQRNTMRQILLLMGYAVFIFQAGIFLFQVLIVFGYPSRFLENIWACIGLVAIIYCVRHATITYLRWLFNNEKEMTLFGFDISIFNIMVGLVLLPINVVLNFGPESMYKPLIIIGLIAIGVAYIMRQFRWMLTARRLIANSLFLFFVYLCAIEILPLWAISKFFW